jgi:hypothetical protein
MLTNADKKYWAPDVDLIARLTARILPDAKVLEVGPGNARFLRANTFVDWTKPVGVSPEKFVRVDFNRDRLPFGDKAFDFVYCRHTLEDLYNPFLLCAEMSRVAKAGYIETPSPLAEICRGIDGNSPRWRGYHHHRYLVWSSDGVLHLLTKYPIIEHIAIDNEVSAIENRLRTERRYWNTYHLWSSNLATRYYQHEIDYVLVRDYPALVSHAISASIAATDSFMASLT